MSEGKTPDEYGETISHYVEIRSLPIDHHVVALCVSGNHLFSGGPQLTIMMWDMAGKCLKVMRGHTDLVVTLCVTPDGSRLFSGSCDNTIKVWDMAGKCLQTLHGHTADVNSICVSPDGLKLFSGSDDNTIKVWDMTGKCVQTLKGHTDMVLSVCVSADGSRLFSGSSDAKIKVWDMTGKCVQTLGGHEGSVTTVCVSEEWLFSGNSDGTIKVWDMTLQKWVQTLQGHSSTVNSVCVSADGSRLFSGSDDSTIKVWNMSGECVDTLYGHTSYVVAVRVSADGSRLFSGSFDETNTVKVWELNNDVQLTSSRSNTDLTDERFANAETNGEMIDLTTAHGGRTGGEAKSGGESKSSNYMKMGFVSPHKALNIKLPDFSGFNCYHKHLDSRLRCKLTEVQKYKEDVQKVERLRWKQRKDAGAKLSVYLFLCVRNKDNILQPDLNVYVYCAFALQSLGWKHRMIIYDERADHKSLLKTAALLKYPLSVAFLKQNVVCMPYVNNYAKLQTAVKNIEDDEEIALVYLSAHGDERGVLYGPWDGIADVALTDKRLVSFGQELHNNMSSDCQVFLNSCHAGKSTAITLSEHLGGRIVLAASDSILSRKVVHRFQIDAGNNRLYFSAQCLTSEIKAYSTHPVPKRALERATSGNKRPRQRQRRSQDSKSETNSLLSLPRRFNKISFRF